MRALDLILNGWELHRETGGITVYLRLLAEALARPPETLSWRLALPRPYAHLGNFLPPEKLLLIDGVDIQGYFSRNIYWSHQIARHVRRHHPESVFHCVYHFWAPLPPRKLLITIHDCIEEIEPSVRSKKILPRLHRWLCRRCARRAVGLIAISNWTRQQVVSHYRIRPEKISVLYNWVRPACQRLVSTDEIAGVRQRYNLPGRYIAYVGGYRAYKNVEFLIAAWALAQIKQPTPPLVLAGHIPAQNQTGFMCDIHSAIAKTGAASDQIILPGLIADKDLPAFYAGAALFISPSKQEGFGYPAVEAMACGTPVLVSDASVYPELIPEAHLRFGLDAPDILADRIQTALADPAKFTRAVDSRFTEAYGKNEYERIVRELSSLA